MLCRLYALADVCREWMKIIVISIANTLLIFILGYIKQNKQSTYINKSFLSEVKGTRYKYISLM